MSNKKYDDFNIEQIIPILCDLNNGIFVTIHMFKSLDDYKCDTQIVINKIKKIKSVSLDIRSTIDKNVNSLMILLDENANKLLSFKNTKIRKEKLFDRLSRGLFYIYKLPNGTTVQPNESLKFDNISIDVYHHYIKIDKNTFQFSDSFDLCHDYPEDVCISGSNDVCISDGRLCIISGSLCTTSDNTNDVKCNQEFKSEIIIEKLYAELDKIEIIKLRLDILKTTLLYAKNIIIGDIVHFKLFDQELLKLVEN